MFCIASDAIYKYKYNYNNKCKNNIKYRYKPVRVFGLFTPLEFSLFCQKMKNSVEFLRRGMWITQVIPREQRDRGNPHPMEEIATSANGLLAMTQR